MAEPQQPTWYGSGGRFRNKIYVGNLSSRTRENDLKERFSKYGKVAGIVLNNLDEYEFHGRKWVVEPARRGPGHPPKTAYPDNHRRNNYLGNGHTNNYAYGHYSGSGRGGYRGRRGNHSSFQRKPAGMRPQRGDYRIQVLGLSSATSWQDLKDWARKAGDSVCYGDVFVDCGRRMGIIEYSSKDDYMYALNHLNKDKLHGKKLVVYKDGDVAPNLNIDDDDDGKDDNGKDSDSMSNERHGTSRSYHHHRERGANRADLPTETGKGSKSRGSHHHHRHHRGRDRRRRHKENEESGSGSSGASRSPSRSRSRHRSMRTHRHRSSRHRRDREKRSRKRRSRSGGSQSGSGSRSKSKSRSGSRSVSRSRSVGSSKSKEGQNGKKTKRDEMPTETQLSGHKESKHGDPKSKKNGHDSTEQDGDVKMEMNGKEIKKEVSKKAETKKPETKNGSTAKERRGGGKSRSRSRSRSSA